MILVTGGTGFVGTYLLFQLTSAGRNVKSLVRSMKKTENVRKAFQCLEGGEELFNRIEWIEGDVTDYRSVFNALEGIRQVYHCAAIISFDPRDRRRMMHVNVDGTANVVNASLLQGVEKLVHVSSIASLGHSETAGPVDENAKWKTSKRNSGYAISKYGGEREVWRGIEEGLNAVIVNPSVILGPVCQSSISNSFLHRIDKLLIFYNKGVNGYVDVRDVAGAMILLMESPVNGERYILNSENVPLRELFGQTAKILGKKPPFIPVGNWVLNMAWRFEWIRSHLTRQPALFTRENMRSAQSRSYYSAEKFRKQFNYSFIPIRESLEYFFRMQHKAAR